MKQYDFWKKLIHLSERNGLSLLIIYWRLRIYESHIFELRIKTWIGDPRSDVHYLGSSENKA